MLLAHRTRDASSDGVRPLRRRRLFSGAAHRESGVALIEGAIVTPMFLLLVLGLFDGSWALFGNHVLDGSSAAGVRTVSALANDSNADYLALQAVKKNMSALGAGALQRVVIYRANGVGDQPTAPCRAGTAYAGDPTTRAGACNVYEGISLTRAASFFGCEDTTDPDYKWCPTGRRTSLRGANSPPDFVGVWVQARFTPLTGTVIGYSRTVTSHTVLRIEPRIR